MGRTYVHWPPEVLKSYIEAIGYVNINGGRFLDLLESDVQTKLKGQRYKDMHEGWRAVLAILAVEHPHFNIGDWKKLKEKWRRMKREERRSGAAIKSYQYHDDSDQDEGIEEREEEQNDDFELEDTVGDEDDAERDTVPATPPRSSLKRIMVEPNQQFTQDEDGMLTLTTSKRERLLQEKNIKPDAEESDELNKLRAQQIKTEIREKEMRIRLMKFKHDQEEARAKELHEGALKQQELQCQLLQAQIDATRLKSTSSSSSSLTASKPTYVINPNLNVSD